MEARRSHPRGLGLQDTDTLVVHPAPGSVSGHGEPEAPPGTPAPVAARPPHSHTFLQAASCVSASYLSGSFSSLTAAIELLAAVTFLTCIFVDHGEPLVKQTAPAETLPPAPPSERASVHSQELSRGWGRGAGGEHATLPWQQLPQLFI